MEQFDTLQSAAATFQSMGCHGSENHYVFASDQVVQSASGAYYGGGLVGYAIGNAVQANSSKQTLFPERYLFVMLDVTETGIGALAVKTILRRLLKVRSYSMCFIAICRVLV